MTPQELAELHPRLYHITANSWQDIKQHGLLSTNGLLDLYVVTEPERSCLSSQPRPPGVVLKHQGLIDVKLNDNTPLNASILCKCLDDDLSVADWMHLLNERVFFWTTEENMLNHLQAFLRNRDGGSPPIEVLVIDTLSLATEYSGQIELCAINSGVAIRNAARRGLQTFTPMVNYDYKTWRKLRGKTDKIKELTVVNGVKNIEAHVVEVLQK